MTNKVDYKMLPVKERIVSKTNTIHLTPQFQKPDAATAWKPALQALWTTGT